MAVAALEDYKETLKQEAEKLVLKQFPTKALELLQLSQSKQFNSYTKDKGCYDTGTQIATTSPSESTRCSTQSEPEGDSTQKGTVVVPTNQTLFDLIEILKPILRDAIESSKKVAMWIIFLMPKISDGDNFGVEVQDGMLKEVYSFEDSANKHLDRVNQYFECRADIAKKITKFPFVEDYRIALQDWDESVFHSLRYTLIELVNHYSAVHDMIEKNLEKIKKPRSNNDSHMY